MGSNLFPNLASVIIPIWLRDTYARVAAQPLYNLQGPFVEDITTEALARDEIVKGLTGSNLFISGGDVFGHLHRTLTDATCNDVITIVIRGLRDLYWNHRDTLPPDELSQLDLSMRQPLPSFKNIFEYRSLAPLREVMNIPMYQAFGTITSYSVVHIPVRHFIQAINMNAPIDIALQDTNVIIRLDYESYDFWDFETESLVKYIDLNARCS